MSPVAVSDKTFGREVLAAATPVLVEFSAEHAPSNASLNELSGEMAGRVKIVKVDVHRNPTLKDEYGVRGLPALVLFKYGKPVARRVGGQLSKAELSEWMDGALILALVTSRKSASRSATDFKLANGLQVVVIADHRAPVVTHLVWYKVGTADEPKDFTGLTRFLGHLSSKSLNKFAGGDFGKAILRIGGETNGLAGREATLYWHRVPRDQLEVVMKLEADRMVNLHLTEKEVATEREVLLEQRLSSLDTQPDARLVEEMRAALYRGRRHNVPSGVAAKEIGRLSREDALRFHKLHYAPNNAILVVVGDVTHEEVRRLAVEAYGKIAANPDFDLHFGRGGSLKGAPKHTVRRVTLEDIGAETARLRRSYAVPDYGTALPGEAEALQVLAKILAGGAASRLYRKLVIENKVATAVSSAYFSNVADEGELALSAVANGSDLFAVEAAVDDAIEDIRRRGVSQTELRCAKKSLVANRIYRGADQLDLARLYGRAAALGRSAKDVEDWPAAISRVSATDVSRVAKTYLVPRRSMTGWLSTKHPKLPRRTETSASERRFV